MSMIGRYQQLTPAQMDVAISQPKLAEEMAYGGPGTGSLDIDKSWHIIHFLRTGRLWGGEGPLACAVLGGRVLEGTDTGYGPFRYLMPQEVRQVSEALATVPFIDLWSRLKLEETEQIYPGSWGAEGDIERTYVSRNYEAMCSFYEAASKSGNAVLLYIA